MDIVVLHKDKDYVLLPKEKYDSMKATIETLQDKEVMKQLKESYGAPSKSLKEVKKELSIQ